LLSYFVEKLAENVTSIAAACECIQRDAFAFDIKAFPSFYPPLFFAPLLKRAQNFGQLWA